jgi:hypothetical protein
MPSARSLLLLALSVFGTLALASCDGSESPATASSNVDRSQARAPRPSTSNPARKEPRRPGEYIAPSRDRISTEDRPSVARYPNGRESDEVGQSGADPARPCHLVSRSEAAAVLGGDVRVTVGLQGPTCIYAARDSKLQVTLAIERIDLASLRHRAGNAPRIRVGRRSGWCLHYGSASVAVPLADGRVLDVTGPCPIAARFAVRSLDRMARQS